MDVRFRRYDEIGGVRRILRRYQNGNLTLHEIGDLCGVCGETVRQDFIKFLRQNTEQSKSNLRSPGRRPALKEFHVELGVKRAFKALECEEKIGEAEKKASRAFLELIRQHTELLAVQLSTCGVLSIKTKVGWVPVRMAIANPKLREYRLGFYRFRPAMKASPEGVRVYAIVDSGTVVPYIFIDNQLENIRSLNLRFRDFDRGSKYDSARERWALL